MPQRDESKFEKFDTKGYIKAMESGEIPPAAMTILCRVSEGNNGKPQFSTEFMAGDPLNKPDGTPDEAAAVVVLNTIIGAAMTVSKYMAQRSGITLEVWSKMILTAASELEGADINEMVAMHTGKKDD